MSKKDLGWEYLNSDSMESITKEDDDVIHTNLDGSESYYGNDGSWGYKNSDGSGSYHGNDGSWGYKNSDGSGSYHGNDGSWGYKNSDGSMSYHGADGSWGYKNTDGSEFYHENENRNTYDESDEGNNEDSSDESLDLATTLTKLATGIGSIAYAKYKADELEKEKLEKEKQDIRKKENALRKKRAKALLLNRKKLEIDFSTDDLLGEHFEYVLDILKENGFNNYKTVPIKDIYIGSNYSCGEVSQVIINGQTQVNKNELIPYDAEIVVTYHLKREIEFPYSSQKLIRRDYKNITQELFDLGFTEIHTVPLLDLTTGWLVKDGSIEKVSVGGNQTFKKTTPFEYDTEIIIEYHTFKKKR